MVPQFILDLPTPRLLAYYKKHYRKPNPYTDYYGEVAVDDQAVYDEWNADKETLKNELATREHVQHD